MAAVKRTRWVCPTCDDGRLGPTRPRKDNIVRYCLPCSAAAGKLVERATPALDKRRVAQADKAKAKYGAKVKRQKTIAKKRTHLTLWDDGGRIVEVDVEKTVRGFAEKVGMRTSFHLTWNRRSDGCNTGRANGSRVHLSVGSRSLEDFCMLAAHELAHAKAGGGHGHDGYWKDAYEEICAKLWDTSPVCRVEVENYRYAIDPKITGQLLATSRGDYKRSKAKLPLAGKQIGSWEDREFKCKAHTGWSLHPAKGYVSNAPGPGYTRSPCDGGTIPEEACGGPHRCDGLLIASNRRECSGPDCTECNGAEVIPARKCDSCQGSGLTTKRVEVTNEV